MSSEVEATRIPVPKSGSTEIYNVLSFDGGGIRGISSMVILKKLMDRVRDFENAANMAKGKPEDPTERKPVDYFDLGAGTSTGGLIALMLFRLEMNCTDVIASYNDLAKLVFQPKLGIISLHKLGRFGVWLGNRWLNLKAVTGREQYSHKPLEQAIDTVVGKYPLDQDDATKKGDAYLVKESKGQM
jgi:patatin-like phospholipase/acyl hydrolase